MAVLSGPRHTPLQLPGSISIHHRRFLATQHILFMGQYSLVCLCVTGTYSQVCCKNNTGRRLTKMLVFGSW